MATRDEIHRLLNGVPDDPNQMHYGVRMCIKPWHNRSWARLLLMFPPTFTG